jgi:hypothetical protein
MKEGVGMTITPRTKLYIVTIQEGWGKERIVTQYPHDSLQRAIAEAKATAETATDTVVYVMELGSTVRQYSGQAR